MGALPYSVAHHSSVASWDLPEAPYEIEVINDAFGHSTGDEVLVTLSRLLEGSTRAEDTVCRFGGEEFVIFLPGLGKETVSQRAEAWREEFEMCSMECRGRKIGTTMSVGVFTFSRDSVPFSLAIQHADAALYEAKKAGRNRVSVREYPE